MVNFAVLIISLLVLDLIKAFSLTNTKTNPLGVVKEGGSLLLSCKVDDDYEFCKFVHKNKFCDFVWKRDKWNITEADCNDFKGRMFWSGNYDDHLCAITITDAKSEDAGRWRCEVESYAKGKYRGYGYNVTSEFDIKFIPKVLTSTTAATKNSQGIGTLLSGPSDAGGVCPAPAYKYGEAGEDFCCCESGCCWNKCTFSSPPLNCLQGIPNTQWNFNDQLGYFQAFKAQESMENKNTTTIFSQRSSIIAGTGAAICGALGIIVNIMAIIMVLKQPKIRNHLTSPILFIMCASNLCWSLISMPITSYRFFHRDNWTDPEGIFCKLQPLIFYATINVCCMTTALISLSRAMALWNFESAKNTFTWKKTLIYYAAIWIYSVGFMSFPLFENDIWGGYKYYPSTFSCTLDKDFPVKKIFIGISAIIILTTLIVTCVVMKCSTDRMFYNSKNVSQELTEAIIKSEREVTRTSVIVVLSFILLYMPYIIDGAFINRDFHKNGNHPGIRIVVYMIFWSSTFVNTCIYVCSNRLYDSAFYQTYGFSPSCMKHEPDQKSLRLKTLKISKNYRSR